MFLLVPLLMSQECESVSSITLLVIGDSLLGLHVWVGSCQPSQHDVVDFDLS